jgi:hypothetical protein
MVTKNRVDGEVEKVETSKRSNFRLMGVAAALAVASFIPQVAYSAGDSDNINAKVSDSSVKMRTDSKQVDIPIYYRVRSGFTLAGDRKATRDNPLAVTTTVTDATDKNGVGQTQYVRGLTNKGNMHSTGVGKNPMASKGPNGLNVHLDGFVMTYDVVEGMTANRAMVKTIPLPDLKNGTRIEIGEYFEDGEVVGYVKNLETGTVTEAQYTAYGADEFKGGPYTVRESYEAKRERVDLPLPKLAYDDTDTFNPLLLAKRHSKIRSPSVDQKREELDSIQSGVFNQTNFFSGVETEKMVTDPKSKEGQAMAKTVYHINPDKASKGPVQGEQWIYEFQCVGRACDDINRMALVSKPAVISRDSAKNISNVLKAPLGYQAYIEGENFVTGK